jgi:hypothetical protein
MGSTSRDCLSHFEISYEAGQHHCEVKVNSHLYLRNSSSDCSGPIQTFGDVPVKVPNAAEMPLNLESLRSKDS